MWMNQGKKREKKGKHMWTTLEKTLSLCNGFFHAESYRLDIHSMTTLASAETFLPAVQHSCM